MPVLIVGCLTLGAALVRGTTVPRWTAVLLAGCGALAPVSFAFPALRGPGVALPYVAFAALGAALLTRLTDVRARRPHRAPRVAHAAAAE